MNMEHRQMLIDVVEKSIFPTSWNVDLGIPFVFDVFRFTVASNSDKYVTVTRYRLDIQWERSAASKAPSYVLSSTAMFVLQDDWVCRYEGMGTMRIDLLHPLKSHTYMRAINPPVLEWLPDESAYMSYTFECSSDADAVWKGVEGATENELGRAPTAVGKLCTIMIKDDDGLDWEVCGRAGRGLRARLIRVKEGAETKRYIDFCIYDFFAG